MEDGVFRKVAPGVFVNKKITVSIPHPDPCWVIVEKEGSDVVMVSDGNLLVFSDAEKAKKVMEGESEDSYFIEKFSWDNLVDKFGKRLSSTLVDKENKPGFYQSVPLQKGI